ncbi:MAG: SGNH/GDSL hydrolase family protein [Candidatus Omnitrophota bacterium]
MKFKKIFVAFVVIFMILELLTRILLSVKGMGFFREKRFISPWFTVYDSPAPYEDKGLLFFKRGQKTTVEKPLNTIRIICLGGSTTIDAATKNHYPGVLQDMLNSRYKNVRFEVLNAGGDAFSSAHSLVNLSLRLIYYKPDCVIIYHNINDLSANYFPPSLRMDYANKYINNLYLAPECKIGIQKYLFNFRFLSFIMMKINNINFARNASRINRSLDISFGARVFSNNLVNIVVIAKAHNIQVVFGQQAACFKKMKEFPYIKKEDFLFYNKVVRDVAQEYNVPVADIFSLLGQDEQYFTDLVHYTESGVNKVSEGFLDVITKIYPDEQKE